MRFPINVCVGAIFLAGTALAGRAQAGNVDEARAYVEKATAEYALNKYAAAAENFEKAFELKPDPALLYNAAQSYRLAGNKERALALYESFLRVYPKEKKRAEIESHIQQLRSAIEHDRAASTSPPYGTAPVAIGSGDAHAAPPAVPPPAPTAPPPAAVTPPPSAPVTPIASAAEPPPAPASSVPAAPAPTASPSSSVVLTQTADTGSKDESLTHKTWFWVAVGGGVVAVALVVVLLASGGSNPAAASIGKVAGN
jgi:hypothetical protein